MSYLVRLTRTPIMRMAKRGVANQSPVEQARMLQNFDPEHYDVPLRFPSMDDCMEPYGSWKTAYEAERKKANRLVMLGIACFGATMTFVVQSGVLDPLMMPNLDNIMEDTEPFEFDKTDRVTV